MRPPRFRIRTLMIAVAITGVECTFAAYAISELLRQFGPNPLPPGSWRWVLQYVALYNAMAAVPAFILWYLWRFTSRLFRACDDATRRADMRRRYRAS